MTPLGTLFLAVCTLSMVGEPTPEHDGSTGRAPNCGVQSLYLLCRLEGQPTTLSAIVEQPTTRGTSLSMKQVSDAAAAVRLPVIGVKLRTDGNALDRPALVFMNQRPHGHFVVIRPVGTSGRLVQVLDPNREPEVIDATDLYASPEWTGLALVPTRTNWWARGACLLGGAAALAWVIASTLTRKRQASDPERPNLAPILPPAATP